MSGGGPRPRRRTRALDPLAVALALCTLAACGKKGPPLAPLHHVPGPPTEVQLRRSADEVRLRFVLPTANIQGPGPVSLDRLEVFAATVAADSLTPPNRDLLVDKYLVGTIQVKPPVKEGATPPAGAPPDTRPAAGEPTTFVETLNAAKLEPQISIKAPPLPAAAAAATTTAIAAAATAAVQEAPMKRRIYIVRGLTRGGRPGQPSARAVLPIGDLPAPPTAVAVSAGEQSLTVEWTAPVPELGAKPPTFNVYRRDEPVPLNTAPIADARFERAGVTFGTEECFVVRTAVATGNVTVESAPSAPVCVTPADLFAPAAPKGLAAVGVSGAINLIWEANTESDLGGYIVLRGEAPGDTLQAITATPIRETTYRDTTVKPGVRYVYAVVAVDRATPPNMSPQSAKVEESAR